MSSARWTSGGRAEFRARGGRHKVPVIKSLHDMISPIIRQYPAVLPADIHASEALQLHASEIFDALGSQL